MLCDRTAELTLNMSSFGSYSGAGKLQRVIYQLIGSSLGVGATDFASDIYPNQSSLYIDPVEWCSGRRAFVQVKTLRWAACPRSGQNYTSPPVRFWINNTPSWTWTTQKTPPILAEGGVSALLFCPFRILLVSFFFEGLSLRKTLSFTD